MDDAEALEVARTLNEDRRHLSVEQRRPMVVELRQAGHTYRAIGAVLGVNETVALRDARGWQKKPPVDAAVAGVGCPTPERVTGLDGKSYPAQKRKPAEPWGPFPPGYRPKPPAALDSTITKEED